MRELLKQHKDMVINFVLVGALMAMILGPGLTYIGAGTGNLVHDTEYENYEDAAQLKTVAAIPKPTIKCRDEKQWKKGSPVIVNQAFQATDVTGLELEMKVLQVKDAIGTDLTDQYQIDIDGITFPEPGCYFFKLRTMDSNKKVTTEEIPLIIDATG